jgi:hypothetical protein
MKTRDVVIFSGTKFKVPQNVQRIDTYSTHGWQVRYHGTKFFSDGTPDGSGAQKSLDRATKELLHRIATMPAPVTLKREPSPNKTTDLPPGISGPIVVNRSGALSAVLQISIPRFGKDTQVKRLYLGTPNTYTKKKFKAALERAVEMRNEAQSQYEEDATRARRRAANALKKTLRTAGR